MLSLCLGFVTIRVVLDSYDAVAMAMSFCLQSPTYSCGGGCHGDEQFSPGETADAMLTEAPNLR